MLSLNFLIFLSIIKPTGVEFQVYAYYSAHLFWFGFGFFVPALHPPAFLQHPKLIMPMWVVMTLMKSISFRLVIALPSPGRNPVVFGAWLWVVAAHPRCGVQVPCGPARASGQEVLAQGGLQARGLPALLKLTLQESPARRRAGNWESPISGWRLGSLACLCCPCVPAVATGTAPVGSSASCSDSLPTGDPQISQPHGC